MVLRLNFLDHIWCQVGVGSTYTIDFKSVDGVCLMVDFRTLKTCKPLPGDSTIFTAELIYFKSDKKCRIWPTRSVACNLLRLKECCWDPLGMYYFPTHSYVRSSINSLKSHDWVRQGGHLLFDALSHPGGNERADTLARAVSRKVPADSAAALLWLPGRCLGGGENRLEEKVERCHKCRNSAIWRTSFDCGPPYQCPGQPKRTPTTCELAQLG